MKSDAEQKIANEALRALRQLQSSLPVATEVDGEVEALV